MAGRLIFHCDGNNFFASCECIEHPEWRDVPMAVAGDPKDRCGIVVAKNELAKKAGVKTTDTIWQARQKCPNILFVPPHHDEYARVSRRMNAIFREYTDFVEPASIDESYLDMTGAPGFYGLSPRELADLLRKRVREEIGITISVGVSFCKVFAKMGSDYRKPDATTLIFRENYQEMLYPLPVATMLYAGRASVQTMTRHGIRTIGELAARPRADLRRMLGKSGEQLWLYANGLDDSPVRRYEDRQEVKSVSRGMTFRRDLVNMEEVRCGVSVLVDEIAATLRQSGLKGSVISVTLKAPTLHTLSHQVTLPHPTYLQQEIRTVTMQLITDHWSVSAKSPVRSITVGVSHLSGENEAYTEQLSLFDLCTSVGNAEKEPTVGLEKQEKVEAAVAKLRKRLGNDAVSLGCYDNDEIGVRQYGKKR